ncbi:relaxosome protein TraM [Arsenophonus sp. PmNCSU2021_1]|uniref:relaxosome protein TraM n=1 Tax=Arsenophonus sp. PmNCSU2021_1 TaxID=3118989 RepID=UPI002FF273D4
MKGEKNHPVLLKIPFSIMDFIDEMVDEKLKDGENKSTANRTAVALEILKIGVRVLKKKNEQMGNKDISLDEKLALIADAVLKSELKLDSMFEFAHKRPQDIDDNMIKAFGYQAVKERINEVDYKVSHFFRQK